jgi:RNA polymerase sigma-70 factor (ECF subfamily)
MKNIQVASLEKESIEKLKKGDLEAFDSIYGLYSAKLYAFGMKYLRSEADAEELVQSVFIKIWENRKKIDSDLSFRSYLFTIAYNDICKLFRSRTYLQKYLSDAIVTGEGASSETEKSTEYQSVLDEIRKIVDTLPEKQRTVFIKSRFEGRGAKDIAEEMNLSAATVDNYISAALRLIRTRLGRETLPVLLFMVLFLA